MKVEMFVIPGCSECAAARARLRAAAQEVAKNLEWRELNVLDDLDYAVELGVMTPPSIVIDGELVFSSTPTVAQLRDALIERHGARA
jgi:thioredoxin 1